MVKIKTKKKLTLPELIKWACVNGITNKRYVGNKGGEVYFDGLRRFRTSGEVYPEETFKVEVEEEITEDTKIANLVQVYKEDNNTFVSAWTGDTIKEITALTKRNGCSSIAFYMLNDDMTLSLIWKEGSFYKQS